jgi:TonB family protein
MISLVLTGLLAAGGLSKDAILSVVKQHQNEIKFCYEQQLLKDPQLAGKVVLDFTVGPDGRVTSANVADESTLRGPAVGTCMTARVRRWKFPRPEGGGEVNVRFPWVFKAADGAPEPAPPEPAPAPEPPEAPAAVSPEPPPDAMDRAPEPDTRLRDELMREADRPRSLVESWEAGGFGMYPIALGLLLGLLCGALALAVALAKQWKAAVVAAGLCLGGAGWSFSCGWLGYVNGMIGSYKAVAHVNPLDRDVILHVAESEASVCWKFGAIALGINGLLGVAALGLSLQRKGAANV